MQGKGSAVNKTGHKLRSLRKSLLTPACKSYDLCPTDIASVGPKYVRCWYIYQTRASSDHKRVKLDNTILQSGRVWQILAQNMGCFPTSYDPALPLPEPSVDGNMCIAIPLTIINSQSCRCSTCDEDSAPIN